MSDLLSLDQAPAGLGAALRNAGFEQFTAIQHAVLQPELSDRDLRISSQTGSGKTVALGLLLGPSVADACAQQLPRKARSPRPAA
ncbi:MAG: DEAD/DEAH box helicase, partial [Polyangiales bacterium]